MYKDYALSPTLFHWKSQSTTSESSPTGQRYINHLSLDSSVCLFARESPATVPFVFLGKGTYVQHERERPMRITWRLDHSVPGDFYLVARAAAHRSGPAPRTAAAPAPRKLAAQTASTRRSPSASIGRPAGASLLP
jgi:hypothetical protein